MYPSYKIAGKIAEQKYMNEFLKKRIRAAGDSSEVERNIGNYSVCPKIEWKIDLMHPICKCKNIFYKILFEKKN